jgi:hypothetical protein
MREMAIDGFWPLCESRVIAIGAMVGCMGPAGGDGISRAIESEQVVLLFNVVGSIKAACRKIFDEEQDSRTCTKDSVRSSRQFAS